MRKSVGDKNIGETVDLMAVAIGVSDDAIAVQIQSSVPSDNKIPHVTLATPPRGKAFNSNLITDWKKIEHPIKLSGIISAFQ